MTGKQISFYASVNGAGLQNLEIIDRICARYYGLAVKTVKRPKKEFKQRRQKSIPLENPPSLETVARPYTLAAIAFIEKYRPFSTKREKPILTGPPKIASKVDMRDYSGFSRPKHDKAWYAAKKEKKAIAQQPRSRQRPQSKTDQRPALTHGTTAFRRQPVLAQ